MKKLFILVSLVCSLFLIGCMDNSPNIVCGREWNPGLQIVADTSSEFDLKDPLIIQYKNGTGFDFSTLKISFFEGTLANKGNEIWNHEARVTSKMNSYTLQGKSKHSSFMNARELTRKKTPGTVVIEVSAEGRLLSSKEISLVKKK